MRKKKLYEVIILLTAKQLKFLSTHYPEEWRITRKVLQWYVGDNKVNMENKGVPIKEMLEDGENLYIQPQEGYGVPRWRVIPSMEKLVKVKKLKEKKDETTK